MIKKKEQYIACPKCYGILRVRRNGTYKCKLCKSTYTHDEYIESVSRLLASDIQNYNHIAESYVRVYVLKKWIEENNNRLR